MAEQPKDEFVEKAFKELAECSICCEIFDEPKMLTCLHTFCLKCLSSYGKDKQPGEMLPCPVCRQEFQIPDKGFSAIQVNFFINRIKEMYQATQPTAGQPVILCEACGFGNDGETKSTDVENFCVECRQKLCSKCCTLHKQFAICRTHQIVPLKHGDESSIKDLLKTRTSPCEVHPIERVQLYCVNCKLAICLLCYALKHNSHTCEGIDTVAEKERRSICQELEEISKKIEEIKKQEDEVESLKVELNKSAAEAESSIQNTATEIIDLIASHRNKAITDLTEKKQLEDKGLNEKINELQTLRSQMESFYQFSRMLMENGNHAEVARFSEDTHQKAKNLQEKLVPKIPTKQDVELNFQKSEVASKLLQKDSKNLVGDVSVGRLTIQTAAINSPPAKLPVARTTATKAFLTKIQGSGCILGIAVFGSQIYVCRLRSSNVDVYSLTSYQKTKTFSIQGLQDPSDMASCSFSNCIYINGQEDRSIYKIGTDGGKLIDRWKLPEKPFRISVNGNGCVTVTFRDTLFIRVYEANGSLKLEVKLPDDIKSPRNAFFEHFNVYKFVVCHGELGEPFHRVCELDTSGKIIRWYGGAEGSEPNLLNVPVHMIRVPNAINKYLVADLNNHRVHLIEDFQLITHILTGKDGIKLARKLAMCDDRLFVAQDDGCIQVFRINLDYPTCKQS